jgi:hypothetical protein
MFLGLLASHGQDTVWDGFCVYFEGGGVDGHSPLTGSGAEVRHTSPCPRGYVHSRQEILRCFFYMRDGLYGTPVIFGFDHRK